MIGGALDSHGADDPHGARLSHSPTTFIRDLGRAYRASGRKTPIMDVFDEHVYADTSAMPPSMPHAGSTIAEGDYAKLVKLLGQAFDGTAQRGSTLPIFYGEFGVESTIPAEKAGAYTGTESAKTVDEATQARYYAEAFRLALCQPNVIGIMVFHVIDESALGAWQSGPYYADRTPKSSLPAIRDAALAAHAGSAASCPDRTAPTVAISTAGGTVVGSGRGRRRDRQGHAPRQRLGRRRDVRRSVHVRVAAAACGPLPARGHGARRGRQRRADLGGRLGDARAAPRRGEPGALDLQASASATRSSAAAAGAAPSRMTRGSAPVKSSTVDGVPGSSPASTAAPT